MLAGCIDPLAVVNDVPKIAGNTFASGVGDTAVLLTVSYDFGYIDEVAYTVSEEVSAVAWLFANRRTPSPEQFVQIHFTSTRGEVEKPEGFVAPISKFEAVIQTDCVAWEDDTLDAPIAGYIDIIKGEHFDASAEVLVGQFHFEPGELPGKSIDLVYVEDIVRHGFSCVDLQNEGNARVPEATIFLEQFRIRARRSFDIIG